MTVIKTVLAVNQKEASILLTVTKTYANCNKVHLNYAECVA